MWTTEFHKRTKHIDIRYHFLREKYECGELTLMYITSECQKADILTKALPRDRFARLRESMGLVEHYTERKKSYEYRTKPSYDQTDTIQYPAPETSVATTGLRQFMW